MPENHSPRERELVLAPNEYAYVLDTTKGHINCYVGPHKTSLAQTDSPVVFDEMTKRFRNVELSQAIQVAATAPANWYMILKNPARENAHPAAGVASSSVDLEVGRKIIVPGPATFSLWPGQMVRVIEGHRLRSNEYIYVRIYDVDAAQLQWREVLGKPDADESEAPQFISGQKLLITGEDVSFYIPPTGVEVIPDADGAHVREAVTLQRLEYCVLVGEDGKKRYLRGERVVYPEPDEHFLDKFGRCAFRAIELSDTTGIYIKVTAPYTDDEGVAHVEGEELFLTGESRIYFPREEHAIIRHDGREMHHAVAIPRGKGRYVLNRKTGEVALKRGPEMFLPDPRTEVLTRRVLSDKECTLLYPNNREVLQANMFLAGRAPAPERSVSSKKTPAAIVAKAEETDVIERKPFEPPRTITLEGDKYEGAVSVDVWSGYAVQVVDKAGGRRVVQGPTTVLLEYDESLEALKLSTGTPKQESSRVRTAFLRLAGNKVSDAVEVLTQDLVPARVYVKYRVNFEGEDPSRWFQVENYVQLLVDHARSRIKRIARRLSIRELRESVTDTVRDAILGQRGEDGAREGMSFDDNAMRVVDVDVLDLAITDDSVDDLLESAQSEALRRQIEVNQREVAIHDERRLATIERQLAEERQRTRILELELEKRLTEELHTMAEAREAQRLALVQLERARELQDAELAAKIATTRLEADRATHEMALQRKEDFQVLALKAHDARVEGTVKQAQAYSPHLVETLRRLSDTQLLGELSENFSELAAVEGRGVLETARKFLDFVPASVVPTLRSNGVSHDDAERLLED
jgi:major vault protein